MAAKKSAAKSAAKKSPEPKRPVAKPFRIGFLIHDVSRLRRTLYDQAFKPLSLTRSQWWVLANLSRNERGVMQTELARLLNVGKVTVGGLIDRLEASGHVERRADAEDRRAKRLFITPKGYHVIEQMEDVGNSLNAMTLRGIHPSQVKIAEEVLHQIKENIVEILGSAQIEDEEDGD